MNSNKIININSNLKNKKVIITFAFKYGYLKESDNKYGYCHLAEHYICSLLNEKFNLKKVYGSVDNDYLLINIELTNKEFKDEFENLDKDKIDTFIKNIKTLNIDEKILSNEKERLISEINNLYLNIDNEFFEEILDKTIKTPKKIKRKKIKQTKNIKDIKLDNFKKVIKKILNSPTIIFIDKNTNENENKINKKDIFVDDIKISFSKKKKFKIDINNPYYKENYNKFIFFKGLDHKSNIRDKFSLRFILQESITQIEDVLKNQGVYEISYDNYIMNNFGFFWLFISSNKKNELISENNLISEIKKIPKNKFLERNLNKFKKEQIKNLKDSWKTEENRNPWIIEDLLETGVFSSPKILEKEINRISVNDLEKIIKKLFNKENIRVGE